MAVVAAWVVAIYMRNQRPAWITIGAGARIGLVTGLLGAWMATATTGTYLFVMRFALHQGKQLDDMWTSVVVDQAVPQWSAAGMDAQTLASTKALLLSPEGRAGTMLSAMIFFVAILVSFAIGGGALGAKFQARVRKS